MGKFAEELGHLKSHVTYPATRAQVIETCNDYHADKDDAEWMGRSFQRAPTRTPVTS